MTVVATQLKDKQTNAVFLSSILFSYPNATRTFQVEQWQLQQGERIFLHGPSGSGKSTLLNLLCGIVNPQAGRVEINGTQLNTLSQSQRDQFRAQHLGIVFQQFNLIPYLSVLQNLELAAHFAKTDRVTVTAVESMMTTLQLDKRVLNQVVSTLSVGQRQRVAIMRAFVNSPALLLVDEPTSSLDAAARDGFMQMLLSLCEANQSSLIFVSHDTALRSHFTTHIAINDFCSWHSQGAQ